MCTLTLIVRTVALSNNNILVSVERKSGQHTKTTGTFFLSLSITYHYSAVHILLMKAHDNMQVCATVISNIPPGASVLVHPEREDSLAVPRIILSRQYIFLVCVKGINPESGA